MWNEHTKILINKFDNEDDQTRYEKLMIMKHNPKYNTVDNYHGTFEIPDPLFDKWEVYDELKLKHSCISTNRTSIKVSKRKVSTNTKFYDTLWIRKENGLIKISGNGTVQLNENEFGRLIDEMNILLKNEIQITSVNKSNSKCSGLEALEKLKQKRITK